MSFCNFILAMFFVNIIGWFVIWLLKINLPFFERLALSFVFGVSIITHLMFFLNLIGIPFSLVSTVSIPILLIFIFGFKEKGKLQYLHDRLKTKICGLKNTYYCSYKRLSNVEKVILIALLFLTLTALLRAVYWPISDWDAITTYDARAKFFIHDGLMTEVIKKVGERFHPYPPFTSLAHTYFYLFDVHNPTSFYVFIYLSLLVMMYYSLRDHISRLYSLALCLLLAVTPSLLEHASVAYTNLSYTLFLGMGSIYLVRFFEKKNIGLFWVGIFLLSYSAWVRPSTEPFFLGALLLLSLFVYRNKKYWWQLLIFIMLFLLVWLPWLLFLRAIDYSVNNDTWLVGIDSHRIKSIIWATVNGAANWQMLFEMIGTLVSVVNRSLNYVLYFFLASFFLRTFTRNWRPKAAVYSLVFIGVYTSILFLGAYGLFVTWADWRDYFTNSANRLVMAILPLFVYFAGLSFSQRIKL